MVTVATALPLFFASANADAFCRTTTTPNAAGSAAEDGACPAGVPVYHPLGTLSYRTVENEVIPGAVLAEKMKAAFATWTQTNARCTPGITVNVLPPAPAGTPIVGYDRKGPNFNNIGIPATFSKRGTDSLTGTTLFFSQDSGAIFDVDLELDGQAKWSFTDVPPADGIDLQAVLTHSAGHMLGLAHSSSRTSAMYPVYEASSISQRTLDDDDIAAICAIYPNQKQRLAISGLVPVSSCAIADQDPSNQCAAPAAANAGGCSTSGNGSRGGLLGAGVAMGLCALLIRRRSLATR